MLEKKLNGRKWIGRQWQVVIDARFQALPRGYRDEHKRDPGS
jgi:hypothetical protein